MKYQEKISELIVVFIFFVAFSSSPVFAEDPLRWTKTEYLINSFVEIALKNEYSAKPGKVRKWLKPVRYFFIHRVADQALDEQLSKLHLEHLKKITGLDFIQVNNKTKADLQIVFSTEKNLAKELQHEFNISSKQLRRHLLRSSVCLGTFSTTAQGSIQKAIVIIPVDRARAHGKLVSCIVEELTQILGLPNDSEKVYPSIFNDRSYNELLSGLDYLLVKMLYHPQIKVGMTEAAVRPVLKRIIKEYKRLGAIRQAQQKAMESGLYPLLE